MVRITAATRRSRARELIRGLKCRRRFQATHCASDRMLDAIAQRSLTGSVSAVFHWAFRHSRTPFRKRANHAIYNCDHIVCSVGTRPSYLVHNGRIHSCFARSRGCGRGDSTDSGAPCHGIDILSFRYALNAPQRTDQKVPHVWCVAKT